MGLFERLRGRRKPADVASLRFDEDVPGLVKALGAEDPALVADAVEALEYIARIGETERARAQARAADGDLLAAFARLRAAAETSDLTPAAILASGEARSAAQAAIDALGSVGSQAAVPVLSDLVQDSSADPYLRMHAARALGRLGNPESVPILTAILQEPRITRRELLDPRGDLAAAAGQGLLALGDPGLAIVRDAALAGSAAAEEALRTADRTGAAGAGARAVIETLDAQREARRRAEIEARAIAEREQRETRARRHPAAAKLAALIGLPDCVTDAGSIRTDFRSSYDTAVRACRDLGLAVQEHEEPADDGMADTWATVAFEGTDIVVEGGRWFRDVLY